MHIKYILCYVYFDIFQLQLQEKRDELENQSDNIAKGFVAGECDLTVFLKEYKKSRGDFHLIESKLLLSNQ